MILQRQSHSNVNRRTGAAAEFLEKKLERGLVSFTLSELSEETGLSRIAARNQLRRLGPRTRRVAPRQEFYVIVSPEHRAMGAPPATWWLDTYFKWLGVPYYLALQSAAAEYGSASQAVQVAQVMTNRPRRSLTVGRIRIRFFVKKSVERTPTRMLPRAYAPLLISTPGATCLDLVRYASRIGGIERAAETLAPILPLVQRANLQTALKKEPDVATAQRFGYIIDNLYHSKLSNTVERFLPIRLPNVPLEPGAKISRDVDLDARWHVLINAQLHNTT